MEFQARVPTRDVCAVSSLICKEREREGRKESKEKGGREGGKGRGRIGGNEGR